MEEKEKSLLEKTGDMIKASWKWLSGKKRRIALLGGLGTQIFAPHTIAYYISQATFILLGGMDVVESSSKLIKAKLPNGLRKK
ncbi:MAG: hypothetical protein ABIJ40_12845 [Bacteroidota bacterium]